MGQVHRRGLVAPKAADRRPAGSCPRKPSPRSGRPAPEGTANAGFTLIEVVVGFTIIALAVAALSAVLGGGLRAAEVAGRDAARIALAQDVLAEAAATGRPVTRRAGDLEAVAELLPEPGLEPRAGLALVRVTVRVSDGGGPMLELATQRLLPAGGGP